MATKIYTKKFAGILPDIFSVENHFLRTFGGSLQVKDGVSQADTFMHIKTSDADVVLQSYNTGANIAFGSGTGNSSRFGPRQEIKSVDKQVPYKEPLAIHEGVDNFTVNDLPQQVIAERLEEQAKAWAEYLNGVFSETISANASETLTGELTKDGVIKAFADARRILLNNKVNKSLARVAYVTSDVYQLLVTHNLTTSAKKSSANIDEGELLKHNGFILIELADEYFQGEENIYFAVDNVAQAGVGISMTRTIDSEDFYGVAIQGAAKYGVYFPEKNRKAVLKGVLTEAPAAPEEPEA